MLGPDVGERETDTSGRVEHYGRLSIRIREEEETGTAQSRGCSRLNKKRVATNSE